MKTTVKKILSIVTAVTLCAGFISYLPAVSDPAEVNAAVTEKVNVGVDINGPSNRAELRSEHFEDWVISTDGEEFTHTSEETGLTFKVTDGNVGDNKKQIKGFDNKNLMSATGTSPVLTADGVRSTLFKNSTITLEIAGLPAGTHTLTTWHSISFGSYKDQSIALSVNGELVSSGTALPCQVSDDNLAGITYTSFEVVEGQPVTFTFATENRTSMYNIMVLNAFEIDGVHPLKAIKNANPADMEDHFVFENGLSWEAAEGATSHRVFIGTDKYTVSIASRDFPEYQGEITETTFDLSKYNNNYGFDHMKTYYWRVDEVFNDGTIVTGKVYSFNVTHLAFPTAEGYGRFATGGRGGQVIEVTTLEDGYVEDLDEAGNPVLDETGATVKRPIVGSLRWAIESFTGPRTVVFNVGGAINLVDKLTIDGDHGDIYIAGQTAPGGGITINNYTFGAMGAEDVIIRNVRVRIGDISDQSMGGMGLGGCDNSIVDHCSIAWATDEGFSSRNAKNITFQRNIIAESLNNSVHYAASEDGTTVDRDPTKTERHSFAASVSGKIGTFHHNLLVNNTGRNWSMAGGVESDGKTYGGMLDFRYNVVYNWQNRTTDGGARRVQFVGNYYKMGAVSNDMNIFSIDGDELGYSRIDEETGKRIGDWQIAYLEGNKMVAKDGSILLDPVLDDPWKKAATRGMNMTTPEDSKSLEPFYESYVTESTADEAYNSTIADVGAKVPAWDYLDSRYIKEVTEGSYTLTGSKDKLPGIIDSQEDAGGYPNEEDIEYATRPEGFDTDHDGMPNEWEELHSLDPENAADGRTITLSAEGYTNLEMYLCELMGDPLVWKNEDQKPDPTATPTPEPTEVPTATPEVTDTPAPAYKLGDVDADGNVAAADALLVLKHAAKLEILEGDPLLAADVNKDNVIDANDALEILKVAAKLREEFE